VASWAFQCGYGWPPPARQGNQKAKRPPSISGYEKIGLYGAETAE